MPMLAEVSAVTPSIVIGLSGHGFLDLPAFESFVRGGMG